MTYLTVKELQTHLHDEVLEAITRGDEAVALAAIDAAREEAAGYLSRYDTEKIFSATGTRRSPLLLIFVKDIAVWHLINLCNAGNDMAFRKDRYERAVAWLEAVQRGDVEPSLPEKGDTLEGGPGKGTVGIISFGSNPRRCQHF